MSTVDDARAREFWEKAAIAGLERFRLGSVIDAAQTAQDAATLADALLEEWKSSWDEEKREKAAATIEQDSTLYDAMYWMKAAPGRRINITLSTSGQFHCDLVGDSQGMYSGIEGGIIPALKIALAKLPPPPAQACKVDL